MEFIDGIVWAVKSLCCMVSANRIVASGWMERSMVVSAAVIEGILTCVIARHRRMFTKAKWKEGKKLFD
jgi:hypothetical protein